jgi:hypothetical protein
MASGSIPETWISAYVDQLLVIAGRLPDGGMRDAALLRADHVMDLVKAWRAVERGEAKI